MTATILVAVPPRLRPEFFTSSDHARIDALAASIGGEAVWLADSTDIQLWPDAAILITSWGQAPLTADLLARLPALRLVAHTGASVRPFVTPQAFERGIVITQAGQGMARSVAEVALTFTLVLLHQVHRFDHALRGGQPWQAAEDAPARHEILSSTIGVVGASRTGIAYIDLVRALGADVILYDPTVNVDQAQLLGVRLAELDELMSESRIVAVHAPSLPQTHHMIAARELALMPDGAGIVNTARSWLVDEHALLDELRTGRIDAGIDVFDAEPLPVDHPLRQLPNVVLTPHHAAGTVECRLRQGGIVVTEIERFIDGRPLEHAVDAQTLPLMA